MRWSEAGARRLLALRLLRSSLEIPGDQRVGVRDAAGFPERTDPCGPGRGTEPADPIWRLPGAHGDPQQFPAMSDGPCPEHRASCGADQDSSGWLPPHPDGDYLTPPLPPPSH